ncbi:MAG: DNA replication/repair protein RecF [Sphingomonadales bacterium]|nr:DNA replication/repair protein RecF [Sphingomonadales bacterium]MBD3772527.1 DNA replication/repair protein RecF [Paracoccaceae bacterium]
MALSRISLSDFRNHRQTGFDDTQQFNLLVGENGAGKTNVLEALSLFAPGRGLRRAGLAEMAGAAGRGGFAVAASLVPTDGGDAVRLATLVDPRRPGRRAVRINSGDASANSLGEWLALAWLTPAMDGLFMDSAGARRRYLDRLAVALDPAHARHVARYEAALRERNRLLTGERMPDPSWMDGLEKQLAAHGAALGGGRAALIAALRDELAQLPPEPFARPILSYVPGGPAEAEPLQIALREGRARERAAGRTLTGPHRDELDVVMSGKLAPAANCSTGEQKAMLIAITLAHAALAARGRPLVLLLDEVAAHLDPLRRAALFERLVHSGAQAWLTGTELPPFEPIRDRAAIWRVARGEAARID